MHIRCVDSFNNDIKRQCSFLRDKGDKIERIYDMLTNVTPCKFQNIQQHKNMEQ